MSQRVVLLLVVVVALGLVVWGTQSDRSDLADTSPSPSGAAYVSPSPGTGSPTKPKATPSVSAAPLSYSQALQQHTGRLMQFDAYCQVRPSTQIVVKNGQTVMFDNRSGDARWFSLNGVGYQIAGYGYRILPMTSKSLPETVVVDCGAAQNVAKIIVQQ
ncbi:MAG: hypothetical protein AAB864_01560 [Patescibacteria group bacterium]